MLLSVNANLIASQILCVYGFYVSLIYYVVNIEFAN